MEQHLCHAVVDGPDGHHAIVLSTVRASALLMKVRHNRHFWCSRSVGGCGAPLFVVAGPIRRPHFRHPAGSANSCTFERDPLRAKAAYTHLAIQLALVAWLKEQGFTSRIEHVFKDGGRADLHVIVGEETQSIEVQLSPMPETEWVRRDAMYRSQVNVVTWLYGPFSEARAFDEMIERGVSLYVDADLNADSTMVKIGTQGIGDPEWSELGECKLTPEGFWTPHLEGACAQTAAWRAEEDAAARLEAEEENRRRRRQQEDADRESQRIMAQQRFRADPHFLPPFKAPAVGAYSWTLESRQKLHPESKAWVPDIGWGWLDQLPLEYRESATLLAYFVCRIDGGGPLYALQFDDVPDPDGVIADAFVNAGFIVPCAPTLHPRRWQRADL